MRDDAATLKDVVREAFRTFETGDVARVDEFCHAEFLNHEAPRYRGPGGFRAVVTLMRAAFADLTFTEEAILAEANTVVLSTVLRGRHTGEFHGLRPTGRNVAQRQTHWLRLKGGMLVEQRAIRDDLGLLARLGLIPISDGMSAGGDLDIPSCDLFEAAVTASSQWSMGGDQ